MQEKGTAIATGTNLNDVTTVGVYYIADDTTAGNLANLPLTLCGKVLVSDNGNNGLVQLYMPNHSPRIFQRLFWDNAWSEWIEYSKKPILLSQVLSAGQTTVTFLSDKITNNSMLDVYTSVGGLGYTDFSGEAGSCTVTYEAQQTDITVFLEIKEQ